LNPSFSLDKWAETVSNQSEVSVGRYIENLRKAGLK